MDTTFYFDTWKRFVHEGVLDQARLDKRILESWYRCKKERVNPYLNKGMHLLTEEELHNKKAKNSLLIEMTDPYLKKMDPMIKSSGMMALLVDPDGYVLSLLGNEKTLKDARRINFMEGVRWTEAAVGTNAIGTALETKEAVMIQGPEHYSVASHQWSCSATPILDDNGGLLGVIDVSCPVEQSHPFMIGMVTSIAYAIEKELIKRSHSKEITLVQQAAQLAETHHSQLFIVCNQHKQIISASKPIREKIPHVIGMNLQGMLHNRYQINAEMPLYVNEGNGMNGICFFLSEVNTHHQHVFPSSTRPADSFVFKGESGISEVFQRTLQKVKLVAPTDATVFISGETGTGKEMVARAIHENSRRKNGPFISLNCGAIPKDLMESELFGYAEGAFTGAKRQGYKGKFEQAQKGTIFLDEIGEIPHTMQVALLRVLQERKVTPIGGTKEVPLDVRIITATHRDITDLVKRREFREDLYYRLNVYPIDVPPLRNRKEDIPYLIKHICQRNNWSLNRMSIQDLITSLRDYDWPGNIRELTNLLERLHIMLPEQLSGHLPLEQPLELLYLHHPSPPEYSIEERSAEETRLNAREKIQRDLMLDALKRTNGNVTAAAKFLGIPRSTFYKRLKKFGM
ncbi:sigma-54-dependent Fis family transcriptional regulator [Cytobacillus sp. NCCP-133]|uniref:sigma-54-dependent Fis family transcriptional regulator n=1 Tax=Cytobacillus sp. NCCP-133 TaxID=766848 RepID=UPI0022312784|nr:sigma-54-dependent Fis family transcriptional regulator [Cytobacillus sp. NCCP-133]GLB61700.1 sigma-54-dependent Fis family transcriptional regulator [Cytobacillus sp. NCCP-133]